MNGEPIIKGDQIIMPCEWCGQHGHDYMWHGEAIAQGAQAARVERDNARVVWR